MLTLCHCSLQLYYAPGSCVYFCDIFYICVLVCLKAICLFPHLQNRTQQLCIKRKNKKTLKPSRPFCQYQIFVKSFLWSVVLWLCSRNPKFGRRIVIGSKRLVLSLRKILCIWLGHKPLKIVIYLRSVEHSQGPDKIFVSVVWPLKLLQYQRLWYMPGSEKTLPISTRFPI